MRKGSGEDIRWAEIGSHRLWLVVEAHRLLDFYKRASINPRGGFFDLDNRGEPLPTGWPPAPKPTRNLFQTTRMVHCFALAQLMGYPGADRIVDHGMDFLWNGHRDAQRGGYAWSTGYDGHLEPSLQAYGHAFVLLAASSAKLAGHADADRLIADISGLIDRHFWEDAHGASAESFSPGWEKSEAYRGQNSNMHLTEALMAAYDATGDRQYLQRAERIASLLIRSITASNGGRLPEHFHADWSLDLDYRRDVFRPFGSTIGHWLEWSRLLIQLWGSMDRESDWMLSAAEGLFRQAVAEGWDPDRGGFYFTVDWSGRPVDRDRYWWPCTEGIGAAAALGAERGDPFFELWYRRIWNWSDAHLIDRVDGSWHHQLNDALQPVSDPWFGKPDIYHSLQACLLPLLPVDRSLAFGLRSYGLHLNEPKRSP